MRTVCGLVVTILLSMSCGPMPEGTEGTAPTGSEVEAGLVEESPESLPCEVEDEQCPRHYAEIGEDFEPSTHEWTEPEPDLFVDMQ